MKAISHILTIIALSSLVLSSCKEPSFDFAFLSNDKTGEDGGYCFEMEFTDTTASYTTYIAARVNTRIIENAEFDTFPLYVTITSPTGKMASENVIFPIGETGGKVRIGKQGGGTVDIEWPYRDNVRISGEEAGLWKINLRPADRNLAKCLMGMGFSYKKNSRYGKR